MISTATTPALGVGTTIGAVAGAAAMPLQLWLMSRGLAARRRANNARVGDYALPGHDQLGNPQEENPDNPGFDTRGFPMTYAERGPGSGPMTRPTSTLGEFAKVAAGIPWEAVVHPPRTTGQLPPSASPTVTPPEPDVTPPGKAPKAPGEQSMISSILPVGISAGTSLLGGYLQSRAANRAANTQADAAVQAAEINREAGREALQFNRGALQQQQQNIQPWIDAGTGALRTVGDMVKDPGYGFTKEFKAPTPEEAMMDPGIKFQLQQGQAALEASLKAKGLSLSGKAVKEINEFAQGVAGQGYERVYNRAAQDYERTFNVFNQERAARLNPLLSMAGLGQTSVGQLNSAVGQAGSNAANITLGTAANVTDQQTNAAAARASGYAAKGNIWGNTLGNIGNTILDTVTLRELMKRLPVTA